MKGMENHSRKVAYELENQKQEVYSKTVWLIQMESRVKTSASVLLSGGDVLMQTEGVMYIRFLWEQMGVSACGCSVSNPSTLNLGVPSPPNAMAEGGGSATSAWFGWEMIIVEEGSGCYQERKTHFSSSFAFHLERA